MAVSELIHEARPVGVLVGVVEVVVADPVVVVGVVAWTARETKSVRRLTRSTHLYFIHY
jgi:hypothetical protein